ncbi:HAD-IC family P-type ATPase [Gulosibacter massiliensis]|uniref:HAD-IC family P-type ATPase n=1 Tax=Gulosibacter massiliensis TaxID=2479839 RepID=UPI001F496018|nr:HAD-IC family P-type ATPase [Gulosibacter massiliensis]
MEQPDAASELPAQPATFAGLTSAQVEASRAKHGRNELPSTSSRSLWAILRTHVFTLFNGIVVASFALLAVLGRWQDAVFGFSAIANSIIGIWQEFSAKRQLDNLRVLNAPHARAVRDGEPTDLMREDLVVDDLIVVRAGDQVPADGTVMTSAGLQLDESLLTGEEDAVDKRPGDEVLSGAIVVAGSGTARVTRVGAHSFAAKLTAEAKRFSLVNSEIRAGINRVLRLVAILLLPVLLISINGQVQAFGGWQQAFASGAWRDAAVGAVAAAIAMVPLGLLLMTSVAFAAGALKLGSRKVLVQELHAVEGLARVDVLCFDKTGTLTEGGVAFDAAHPAPDARPGWQHALATMAADEGANDSARCLETEFTADLALPTVAEVPFTSQRKWSAISLGDDRAAGTWILGAPDIVLRLEHDAALLAQVTELSEQGQRVLALCFSAAALDEAEVEAQHLRDDRVGVAIIALRERVRADAADTVRYFTDEGVSLRVISGDDPRTVTAVARGVGLIGEHETGVDARTLPDDQEQLGELMETHRVFGRVTPTQKRQMVHALQARGRVVAMTGDGVNDVLALKDADLGIAMGHGSGASRAVSRMTLLDNQFQAMPSIVLEGRQAIANIERLAKLYLSKTSWAVLIALIFGLLAWPYPFEPRQMALLDGISIGWPAFVLALLPNSRRYVSGFFRRALQFAVPSGIVITLSLIATHLLLQRFPQSLEQQQTASALVLAVTSLWVLGLVCRPFRPLLAAVLLGSITVLILCLFVPLTVWFFGFAWPDAPALIGIAIITVLGCVALEIHGQLRLRSEARELA